MRLDNLRFFDPGDSPAVRNDPDAAAHARAAAKAEEFATEARETYKLLHDDASKGLLDLSPPKKLPPIEGIGTPPPSKASSLSVSWALEQSPDTTMGRIPILDHFLNSDKAKDIFLPLRAAKRTAEERALAAAAIQAKIAGASPQKVLLDCLLPKPKPRASSTLPLNAPVEAVNKKKFDNGLKAFASILLTIEDEEDKAAGEFYFHALQKVRGFYIYVSIFLSLSLITPFTSPFFFLLFCLGSRTRPSLARGRSSPAFDCILFAQPRCRKETNCR